MSTFDRDRDGITSDVDYHTRWFTGFWKKKSGGMRCAHCGRWLAFGRDDRDLPSQPWCSRCARMLVEATKEMLT